MLKLLNTSSQDSENPLVPLVYWCNTLQATIEIPALNLDIPALNLDIPALNLDTLPLNLAVYASISRWRIFP
jgi:hypothetical protein